MKNRRRWFPVVAAMFAITCTDRPTLLSPEMEPPAGPGLPADAPRAISCMVTVATRQVACAATAQTAATGSEAVLASDLTLGGQNRFVRLTSSDAGYSGRAEEFMVSVTVQNLIGQALGTPDGTTVTGVRVFFHSGPTGVGGPVTVKGAQFGDFTGINQAYYEWPEILLPDEVSRPLQWVFGAGPEVTTFSFVVFVNADVEFPNGWIDVSADRTTLQLDHPEYGTAQLSAVVRDALGRTLDEPVTWSSSAPAIISVDANTGVATAQAHGTAEITASAADGVRVGTIGLTVFNAPPSAQDKDFDALGGVTLNGAGLLDGATDPDHDPSTLVTVAETITGSQDGLVSIAADGTFTYTSAPGFTGTETFPYRVRDPVGAEDTAAVSLSVGDVYWFVDAAYGGEAGPANGTQPRPLTTVAAAATASAAGNQTILVTAGTYAGAVTLKAGTHLRGQSGTPVQRTVNGETVTLLPAGLPPILTGGVTLGASNTLTSLNLNPTTGTALTGFGFGTLTVTSVNVNAAAGAALSFLDGTVNGDFGTLSSSGGSNGVSLVAVAGSFSATGGTITATNSDAFMVSGGSVSVTYPGNITQAAASRLLFVSGGHTGALTFSTGVLSATNGSGLVFDNADGVYTFSGTTTLNGGEARINISAGSAGTFTFGAGTTITNPAGPVVQILSSAPTFTYSGAFLKSGSGPGIIVSSNTGGSVVFNGTGVTKSLSTGASTAVLLAANGGMPIEFSGGSLQLATTSGTAFQATISGSVVLTGAGNTVTTAGGVGVNVQNVTIGGAGMTWQSVNATGAGENGIALGSTGAGAFQVTGAGASDTGNPTRGRLASGSGTGGTISGKSSHGIVLSSTGPVVLRNMLIENNAGDGINATTVTGLTIDNTRITGHTTRNGLLGTAVNDLTVIHSELVSNATDDTGGQVSANNHMNMRMMSATGTASVRASLFQVGAEHSARFMSDSGTLNLTFENNTVSGAAAGTGFSLYAWGSSNITAAVQGNTFQNNSAFGMDSGTETSQPGSLSLTVNGNQFSNNFVGVTVAHGSSGTNTFNVTNNNFQNHGSISVNINRLGSPSFTGFGLFSGTVSENTIGTAGVANSGSAAGSPIRVVTNGNGGTSRVTIVNNTIRQYAEFGISIVPRDATTGHTLHARVQDNSIANPQGASLDGVNVTMGALNTDVLTVCLDISGNTVANPVRNGVRVRSSGLPAANVTLTLPSWDGTGAAYFENRNPASGTASFANGGGTTSAGTCTTP